MKKIFLLLTIALFFSGIISANTADTLSLNDFTALSHKSVADAMDTLYANIEGFDRECFFIGTFDDDMEHYQTFTANKSVDNINDSVKWMFKNCLEFTPDTMSYQRITTYKNDMGNIDLALLAVALFKKDYPDMRALRVCNVCCPERKHYGSEIISFYDLKDPICSSYEIVLYSSTLAKRIAEFFSFSTLSYVISSGGDIGYRGIMKKNKLSTKEQKISFLMGILMRYGCDDCNCIDNSNYSDTYSILIRNSSSTAALCCDILKEIGCEHVMYVDMSPLGRQIIFIPSLEFRNLDKTVYRVNMELRKNMIVF